jgi:hypothetical protein
MKPTTRVLVSLFLLVVALPGQNSLEIASYTPYLGPLNDTSVTISWMTNSPTMANQVDYGQTAAYGSATTSGPGWLAYDGLYVQRVEITGLIPNTLYHYRVISDGQASGDYSFRTFPPSASTHIRFAVYGDSRFGADENAGVDFPHRRIAESIAANENVSLVLHMGDIVDQGEAAPQRWTTQWFSQTQTLQSAAWIATVIGNHEIYPAADGYPAHYLASYRLPKNAANPNHAEFYYSFDIGFVHVVALSNNLSVKSLDDTVKPYYVPENNPFGLNYPITDTQQMRWFMADVAQARQRGQQWLITFAHNPVYTSGGAANHDGPEARDSTQLTGFRDAIETAGTDLFFAGHSHSYTRFLPTSFGVLDPTGQGTRYIVTGGGISSNKDITLVGDAIGTTSYIGNASTVYTTTTPTDWVPWTGSENPTPLGEDNTLHRAAIGLNYHNEAKYHYVLIEIDGNRCRITTKYVDAQGMPYIYDTDEWIKTDIGWEVYLPIVTR